jgi:hypothetical protein
MTWMSCIGPCISCGRVFSFNPERVPSIRWKGEREPVCRDCIESANVIRVACGLAPHAILPGAYDEMEVDG